MPVGRTASFTRRVGTKGSIYLACGHYGGKPTWHYVRVESLKLPLFLKQSKTGSIDVAEFGEVLFSGWGKAPPQPVADLVEKMQ